MSPSNDYVAQRCRDLESTLRDVVNWAAEDDKLGAHLAAYTTVLMSGLVEDCIEHLITMRASDTQDPEIEQFITGAVRRTFRNPDWGAINGLLRNFSERYGRVFSEKVPHNGTIAEALQAIVDNKNSLAHTGAQKLQMTVGDVENYFERIVVLLGAIDDILRP